MSAHSHAEPDHGHAHGHEHGHGHGHGHAHDGHGHDGHAHAKKAAVADDCSNCAAHRPRTAAETARWGWLSGLIPILACALCPVCLSLYATILSAFGVGFAITEGQHAVLLFVAVAAAILAGGFRARVTRRFGPLGLTTLGCMLLIFADVLHENRPLSLVGIAMLVASMIWDRRAAKQPRH